LDAPAKTIPEAKNTRTKIAKAAKVSERRMKKARKVRQSAGRHTNSAVEVGQMLSRHLGPATP